MGAQSGDGLPIAGQKGNTYLGYRSGYNASPNLVGSGNVFLGWQAGEGLSLSNKLIIDNSNLNYNNLEAPLIYGDFEDNFLLVNRNFRIDDGEVFGVNGGPNELFPAIFINAIPYNARPYYGFAIAGEERARILYDGFNDNIRFDNMATFFNFQSDGNATKAVAGSWMANSDARLKKNIQTLDKKEMLEKLLTMKGVQYEWDDNRTSYNRPEGLQIGFIAQDLQEIWPEKIKEDEDGYLMTAYSDYDPIFVESIKALNDKITKQEKTIESLIQKLAELERLIKSGTTSGKNQNTN